jgi:plastocyanin
MHTVTSGNSQEGPNGVFDSDLMAAGDSFEFTFSSQGKEDYYCIVHPWMTGSVEVG